MKIFAIQNSVKQFGSRKQFKKLFSKCSYSGEEFEQGNTKTIEHIIPKSDGGKDNYANYIVVKRSWNEKRSSTPLLDFMRRNPQVKDNIKRTVEALEGKEVEGIIWADEVKKTLQQAIGDDIFK